MPIEIKELHIKVTVNQPVPASSSPSSNAGAKSNPVMEDQFLAECVEQVLHIMKNKNDR